MKIQTNIMSLRNQYRFESGGKVEIVSHDAETNTAYVEGWALCQAENPPSVPESLFVILDGACIHKTNSFPIHRQDVEDYFGIRLSSNEKIVGTGFSFTLHNITNNQLEQLTFLTSSRNGFIYALDYHTATAQIEICGNCNMHCPQCPNVRLSGFSRKELTPDAFLLAKSVVDRSYFVCFDGFGESFLCKQIEEITALIPWFKQLKFHTNGTLLFPKIDFLIKNAPPIYQIIVSLDSLKKSRYSVFRPGGNLDQALNNMFSLKKKREQLNQPYPYVVPNITVNGINHDELSDFLTLAQQLDNVLEIALPFEPDGVASVSVQDNNAAGIYSTISPQHNLDAIHESIKRLLSEAAAKNVKVMLQGFILGETPNNSPDESGSVIDVKDIKKCPMTNGTTIQSDGKGMICPWQIRPVFNWKAENTMDPRETSRGKKVIQMIKQGQIPAECSGSCCPYVGRRKSTETIERISGNFAGGWQVY